MGLIIKVVVAFCIGIGAMWGVQTWWLSSIKKQIAATPPVTLPTVQMTPVAKIDVSKLHQSINPKIDPKIGQDAWRGTINRQVSQSINAGRLVPLPPRTNFPGVPRR
jgi:hypothetical protein